MAAFKMFSVKTLINQHIVRQDTFLTPLKFMYCFETCEHSNLSFISLWYVNLSVSQPESRFNIFKQQQGILKSDFNDSKSH